MRDLVDDLSYLIIQVMESFPDVEPLESPFPEVKKDDLIITNKMYKCPSLRKMHVEIADLNGLKILHSIFYPDPHYNLPIFGCDVVATDKTVTAAIVDVSPVHGVDDRFYSKIREISNRYSFSERRPLPLWADEIFSPYCKFMRLSNFMDMTNFYCIVSEYLNVFSNDLYHSVIDDKEYNRVMLRFDDQIYYCNQQKKNDKTRGILEKLFDKEWADEYINTVLFDLPCLKEQQEK